MDERFEDRHASRRGFFREVLGGLLAPLADVLADRLGISPEEPDGPDRPPLRPPGAGPEDTSADR